MAKMKEQFSEGYYLQQLPTTAEIANAAPPVSDRHLLSPDQEIAIGRDPSCQIVLDSSYGVVSRRMSPSVP
jgi:hypothetical protein